MDVVIETCDVLGEDSNRWAKMFAYVHGDDSTVRDANHALEIVERLTRDGSPIERRRPEYSDACRVLFRVCVEVTNTRKGSTSYRVDYKKYDGCPMEVAEAQMDVYRETKRLIKSARVRK